MFYLQFISVHQVTEGPDGVYDDVDVVGVVRQFVLYVHFVFFQKFNFFLHSSKQLLALSSQSFLSGIENILYQFFLRFSDNAPIKV